MNNSTDTIEPKSGYDIPVYGLDNGLFYFIHIPAITCILCSLTCAVTSVVISFRQHKHKHFFLTWTKSDRFIVYMAICDGCFNISHILDHAHMAITKSHVYPKALCEFYGFCLLWFIAAQMLLVNVIAINIFMLMYFDKNINFGRHDWRLLLYIFGLTFVVSCAALVTDQFGPFGISCYFDPVKGRLSVWFTTVPSVMIVLVNIISYVFTWIRIRHQAAAIKETMHSSTTAHATWHTARRMSLFVAVFVLQWFPIGIHGVWSLIEPVHPVLLFMGVIFPNLGGCFNLGVCLLIRRRHNRQRHNRCHDHTIFGSRQQVNSVCEHLPDNSISSNDRKI